MPKEMRVYHRCFKCSPWVENERLVWQGSQNAECAAHAL